MTSRSTCDTPVGLLPCAGHARRLALTTGSKELLRVPDVGGFGDVPVITYLLRQFRDAGVREAVLARRECKTDLAAHFAATNSSDIVVHDLVVEPTAGSAHTLSLAASSVPDRTVVSGFPDIILTPPSIARDALAQLAACEADVCLAHIPIPAHERDVWDMSTFEGARVVGITMTPGEADYRVAWVLAVWRPSFTAYLAAWIAEHDASSRAAEGEVSLSDALLGAIEAGLHVTSIVEPTGFGLDVGQPERLASARALRPTR